MLDFDARRLRLDQRVGNLPGAQDLAAGGVRGDPRREVHRRSEMAIFSQQRGAMMQAGANHREVPAIGDRHVESRQRIVGDQRVGKHEERAVARQRLQSTRGFDRSPDHCAELVHEIRRCVLAVGIGQRSVAGDVDEAEGRLRW